MSALGGQSTDENMMAVPEPVHGGTAALIKYFDSLNKWAGSMFCILPLNPISPHAVNGLF